MDFKNSIHRKMMLYLLGASLIVYIVSLGYVGLEVRDLSKDMAKTNLIQKSNDLSDKVSGYVDSKVNTVETLASAIKNYIIDEDRECRSFQKKMLKNIVLKDKDIISLWVKMQPVSSDDDYEMSDEMMDEVMDEVATTKPGYCISLYREGGEVIVDEDSEILPKEQDYYDIISENNMSMILNPYKYKAVFDDSALITSVLAPIVIDGEFAGVVGMSFPIGYLEDIFSNSGIEGGQIYLISADSNYVYNPNRAKIGTHQTIIKSNIDSLSQNTVFVGLDDNQRQSLLVFNSIKFVNANWYLVTSLPVKVAYLEANKAFFNVILLIIVGFILLLIVISFVANSISKSVVKINKKLADLSLGIIEKRENEKTIFENEITDLSKSLGDLFESLQSSVDFAGEIGKGKLDTEYHLLSNGDTLGTSLITMQKSLIKAKEEENKKKLLDDQRNWVTHGLANFGEIMRQDNDNIEDFAFNILSQLLKYVDVVQGAIYFKVEDEYEETLKFGNRASIAYGKQVMLESSVITEQDGVFGRVITELKSIYLEDVPNNYVNFTQGKKEKQRPRNLLVVPMVVNDVIYGILELVSYNHFEKYKIEFVEKLCENIASVVSSVNTNIHNAKLLEQSNLQAEELSQHEEEMRQNLEEMQATQEEAAKRYSALNSQIMAFYNGLMVAEIDLDGNIVSMSKKMMSFYDISNNNDQIQGSSYITVVSQDDSARSSYVEFWDELLQKGSGQRNQVTFVRGNELETVEYYKVVYRNDVPHCVMVIAINKTREKELHDRLMVELQAYLQEYGMVNNE